MTSACAQSAALPAEEFEEGAQQFQDVGPSVDHRGDLHKQCIHGVAPIRVDVRRRRTEAYSTVLPRTAFCAKLIFWKERMRFQNLAQLGHHLIVRRAGAWIIERRLDFRPEPAVVRLGIFVRGEFRFHRWQGDTHDTSILRHQVENRIRCC